MFDDIKSYINLRLDGIKLALVENLSTSIAKAISWMIFTLLLVISFLLMSTALALWVGKMIENYAVAFLIVAVFFVLLALLIYSLRNRLFADPMVRSFSKMFFGKKND